MGDLRTLGWRKGVTAARLWDMPGCCPPDRPVRITATLALRIGTTAGMGLGCAKTQACCGAVEWRSQASVFFPSRARLASWRPVTQRRRNLENSAIPTLLARGSRIAFRATMYRAEG